MYLKWFAFFGLLACTAAVQVIEDLNMGPVFIWHGMSECNEYKSTQHMKKLFEEYGSLVKTVRIGETCFDDTLAAYWSIDDQVEVVCKHLTNDPDLANGFTVIGLSQGGLMVRALVQKCSTINVTSLVSFGGIHGGTFQMLPCESSTSELIQFFCVYFRRIEEAFGFGPTGLTPILALIKNLAIPSAWNDPYRQVDGPADIAINHLNNLVNPNATYKTNLLKLKKFIAIYFNPDTVLSPYTTSRFDEYMLGTTEVIIPYNETVHYKNDLIGLRTLDETGRFIPLEIMGMHMTYTDEWLVETIMKKYLAGQANK